MKRILIILSALLATALMCVTSHADMQEFEDGISSQLSDADTGDISEGLEDLGIDPSEPETVGNLSASGLLGAVADMLKKALSKPAKVIVTVAVIAAICRIAMTLSFKTGLYGELFVILCFIAISPQVLDSFGAAFDAMKGCHAFMLSYIPAFAGIVAASGNLTAAVSYNAIVLYFCEGAAMLASYVLRPILCCMLVLSAVQSINSDLSNLISSVRSALTTVIGFVMTVFLGVLGLQTIVGRGADGIAVRAGKYAVSSFVPVIGYSLSESYRAVSLSLSAIRTTVGVFGITVMCLYMLSPIITAVIYKATFLLCGWFCRLMGVWNIASLMSGLSDVFSLCGTVLTVFMLMMTVSTGMLILLGGALLA